MSLNDDMTFFGKKTPSITSNKCKQSYSTCYAIHRLLISLKYFTKFENNNNDEDNFLNFMDNVYSTQIHDDMYHLIKYHQTDLDKIYEELVLNKYSFSKCDLSICTASDRHYRVIKLKEIKTNDNKYLNLYIETMDSLHFLLYHLYDSSLRINSKTIQNQTIANQSDVYYDSRFSEILDEMEKTRNLTNRFSRLTTSKFNINSDNILAVDNVDDVDVVRTDDTDDCDTFLDSTYNRLLCIFDSKLVSNLKEIVIDQEYDTEAVDMDLELLKEDGKSNISQQINNDTFTDEIVNIFNKAKGIYSLYFVYFVYVIYIALYLMIR